MKTITAKPITHNNFYKYGTFTSIINPEGNCFPGYATFYPDQVMMNSSTGRSIAFSPLTVKKQAKMIINMAEYHNYSAEGVLILDDDAIIHVAVPTNGIIIPEETEAFLVPKGTFVLLNAGVWHYAALPVHNEILHALVVLPERTYAVDCKVYNYPEERQVQIIL